MIQEIKPPTPLHLPLDALAVFLAGSIDMGSAHNWQAQALNRIADLASIVLNPRRDDWDASWRQSIDDPQFRAQVEWELDGLKRADLIAMWFERDSQSPITLLELGLNANSAKLIVGCPHGFWRRGNIEVVCKRFDIPLYESFEDFVLALEKRLKELKAQRGMPPFDAITEQMLGEARIEAGMRVLDIGCGFGDVSRRISKMVGSAGQVIGIDKHLPALELAQTLTKEGGITNIEYLQFDLESLPQGLPPFDAVVGRRVLMYLKEPLPILKHLASLLRPGGVCAFQEHSQTMTPGRVGHWPIHDQAHAWLWETVRREGANPHMGLVLPSLLAEAGLRVEHVGAHAIVVGHARGHHAFPTIVKALMPRILHQGVATAEQVDIETLEARLQAERSTNKSVYISDMAFTVIAGKPL